MSKTSNPWFSATLILIIATIIGLGTTLHYYQNFVNADNQYKDSLKTINKLNQILLDISPKIMVKYSNGTEVWYGNLTILPIGWSLFNATHNITNGRIEYQQFAFGTFITSINGVEQSQNNFWLWYIWDANSTSWTFGPTGAEAYRLKSEDIVAWYLSDGSSPP